MENYGQNVSSSSGNAPTNVSLTSTHFSRPSGDISASTADSTEMVDANAFEKLKRGKKTSVEATIFEPLAAKDDLALEGPVMDDMGDYMTLKRAKMAIQYQDDGEMASQDSKASKTLFSGLTAFISTSIYIEHVEALSSQQQSRMIDFKYLSRLWVQHGGAVTQNVTNSQITHYVNSFLPVYFLRELDKIKAKMALVSPFWIIECIRLNKRVPVLNFSLQVVNSEGVAKDGQTTISFTNNKTTDKQNQTSLVSSTVIGEEKIEQEKNEQISDVQRGPADTSRIEQELQSDEEEFGMEDMLDEGGDAGTGHRMKTSAENPNFVADYFSSSRLHHLASWKMKFQEELELYISSLDKETGRTSKPRPPASHQLHIGEHEDDLDAPSPTPIFVHIDMDAFFASVATRNNLLLREKPVVISHGGARATCPSVNYESRKLGISNGMRLGDAQQLARAVGKELIILPYDFAEYEVVSRQVHEIFLQYTKRLHIKSVDEAVLDLTGAREDEVFEKVEEIRRRVFEATRCTCSAGIGSTAMLARFALMKAKPNGIAMAPAWKEEFSSFGRLVLASYNTNMKVEEYHQRALDLFESTKFETLFPHRSIKSSENETKISIDDTNQEPHLKESRTAPKDHNDRLYSEDIVSRPLSAGRCPNGDGELTPFEFLSNFKLGDLPGIGWRTLPKFAGLSTVGDLQRLTLRDLRAKLGHKSGANFFLACRGFDSKPLPFDHASSDRKTISVDLTYGVRFNTDAQFSKFIGDVARELCERCKKIGKFGKSLTIKIWVRHPDAKPTTFLGHGKANTFTKSMQFATATGDSLTIANAAERLVKEFRVPPAEVRGFGLTLSALSKPVAASLSITSMFKAALNKTSSERKTGEIFENGFEVQKEISQSKDGDNSRKEGARIIEIAEEEIDVATTKRDKKRLRTIDSLLEKLVEKSGSSKSKKAKDKVSSNSNVSSRKKSKTLKEETEQKNETIHLFAKTLSASTRVVAYTEVNMSLLKELDVWIRARPEPSAVHGELLFQFVATLLEVRNLEDLHSLARKLTRIGSLYNSWVPFTRPIIEKIQEWVKSEYGSYLPLPSP